MKKTILLFVLVLTAVVCQAKDIKTVVVTTTPQMHCATCEKKIKGNLRFEKGVKKIETDIPAQTVTIEYDAEKTNVEKLLKAFPKFGYEAKPVEPKTPQKSK
ncbi:MAG: heavy-metal-associated domain-containing protein [Prevotella sp.]|nr:heavy-metal-associated domain-containing protein [Prevotella sp.]